jgi:hypothetical protein
MKKTVTSRTMPCTIGKSREKIASTRNLPMPGQLKIVSVMTAPPSSVDG